MTNQIKSERRLGRTLAIMLASLMAIFALVLTGCSSNGESAEEEATTQTITDMAGREVTIPTHPTKIMGAANPDGIMIYSIDSSLLTGWTFELSDEDLVYLDDTAASLPVITSVSKWEEPNKEEILEMAPDFIFVTCDLDNTDFTIYDDLTSEIGVPVVVGDAELANLGDTYRFLGTILDQTDKCDELGAYIDSVFEEVDSTMSQIADDQRVRVFYSTGDDGLQTCGDSNWNGQFVTPAGGINVCDTDQTSGFSDVSMEQVLTWQPQVIISTATGDQAEIYGSSTWADVPAVQDGQVYAAPQTPFSWVDKPTGVNRVIGVLWTNSILYPEQAAYDLETYVKDFYSLFYHYDLTDEQVDSLLDTQVL